MSYQDEYNGYHWSIRFALESFAAALYLVAFLITIIACNMGV